ncbi:MAG: PAS domain-containing protein [Taibaiella sp.]|nr:PAS domain-containing protein [Taibaiella sp.]
MTEKIIENAHAPLVFNHLPGYARFLKDEQLIPFIKEQLRLTRMLDIPLMRYIPKMTDDELIAMSVITTGQFLTFMVENRLEEQVQTAVRQWLNDEMGIVSKDQISAEDITLVSYMRRQSFLNFLPLYTNKPEEIIGIVKELDDYSLYNDTLVTNTYINILREKINANIHLVETINHTVPGMTYIYNLPGNTISYANENYLKFTGINAAELNRNGGEIIRSIIHPDDLQKTADMLHKTLSTENGEIISLEFRIKNADGQYRWVRNYTTVFKRNEQSKAEEVIGIMLDIENEKVIERELINSQQKLLEAQEVANMASFELDIATDELEVSPHFYKVLETTQGLKRKDLLANIHPGDRARAEANMTKAVNERSIYDMEYRYLANEKEKMIWARGTVDETEGRLVMKGTVTDMTERQHLVQRLQSSEILYKQAQAMSHIGNWVMDVTTGELEWSDELYRIYGMAPGATLTYEIIADHNHRDDAEMVATVIANAIKNKEPYDFYYRIVVQGDQIKTLHVKGESLPGTDGETYKLFGTVQDVTQQKLVEKTLIEYREFIEKITDVTPSIIASYNVHTGQYSFINRAVENLLGVSQEAVMNGGVAAMSALVHPDDMAQMMEKNTRALEAANESKPKVGYEEIVEFKYRMKRSDGNYRWFNTYGTIFERDKNGKVESVLNISVDITEQEEAEQILAQKNIELQQSNSSLEEYAFIASHDLKEPLRKISTFSDRLLNTQAQVLSADSKVYLNKIIESTRRMQTMINDLLAVSIISGNREYEETDLNEVLSEALQSIEHTIEEKNATIKVDKLPRATIVPSQFRQLFQNLISNSLKFTREGVALRITITHEYLLPKDVAEFHLIKARKYLRLQFADNGIGFNNEHAQKIFTIFQRLHDRNAYEGTGIGLAICRKITENHKGTIFASGHQGEGATFTIIIPA